MFVDGWTSRSGGMYVFLIRSRDKFKTTHLVPLRRVHCCTLTQFCQTVLNFASVSSYYFLEVRNVGIFQEALLDKKIKTRKKHVHFYLSDFFSAGVCESSENTADNSRKQFQEFIQFGTGMPFHLERIDVQHSESICVMRSK